MENRESTASVSTCAFMSSDIIPAPKQTLLQTRDTMSARANLHGEPLAGVCRGPCARRRMGARGGSGVCGRVGGGRGEEVVLI